MDKLGNLGKCNPYYSVFGVSLVIEGEPMARLIHLITCGESCGKQPPISGELKYVDIGCISCIDYYFGGNPISKMVRFHASHYNA